MDLSFFTSNLTKYSKYFNVNSLFEKIGSFAKKAGVTAIYNALLLYYSSMDKNMPTQDRVIILAALGYFILPVDLIPDLIPGGLVDDGAALSWAVKKVWNNVSDQTKAQAKRRLTQWFGTIKESDLISF